MHYNYPSNTQKETGMANNLNIGIMQGSNQDRESRT